MTAGVIEPFRFETPPAPRRPSPQSTDHFFGLFGLGIGSSFSTGCCGRQRVSRSQRKCDTGLPVGEDVERVLLDAASRAWLRAEVDRRRRDQIESLVAAQRALFQHDPGRVQ
jgi:hypothetical protein